MKVKATNEFKKRGLWPAELNGFIPEAGYEFEVTEERAKVLAGENQYKAKFIEVVKEEKTEEIETAVKEVETEKAVKPVRKTTKKAK